MDFYEVIEKRRTIRDFSDKKIPAEVITRVLEAGIKAPTYNHLREWDYILIRDASIRLRVVQAEGIPDFVDTSSFESIFNGQDETAKGMYYDAIPKQKSMLLKAPELMAVVFKPKTKVSKSRSVYDLNCLASVWCCIENILLALTAEGLGGVTYIPQKCDELKRVLKVPPELEIAALIPFGYKADNVKVPLQKAVDLNKRIHHDQWPANEPQHVK